MNKETHLSTSEAMSAICGLSDDENLRLKSICLQYSRYVGVEWNDLLQEAICRVNEGNRPHPRQLGTIPFLAGVVKSIAYDQYQLISKRNEISLETGGENSLDIPDESANPAKVIANANEVEDIRRSVIELFADDVAAEVIAEGIMDGMEGEELRLLTDLDPTAFQSKRRLIRRRIQKVFSEKCKS